MKGLILAVLLSLLPIAASADWFVVNGSKVNMRAGPESAAPVITQLPRKSLVSLYEKQSDWALVVYPQTHSEQSGWIHQSLLKPLYFGHARGSNVPVDITDSYWFCETGDVTLCALTVDYQLAVLAEEPVLVHCAADVILDFSVQGLSKLGQSAALNVNFLQDGRTGTVSLPFRVNEQVPELHIETLDCQARRR